MLNDIMFVDNTIGLKLGLKLVNLYHLSWRPLAGTNDFPESPNHNWSPAGQTSMACSNMAVDVTLTHA